MNPFPVPPQDDPFAAKKRRHVWEMYADVRAVNTFLLIFSLACALAVVCVACVLLAIFTRPPYILSEDEGMVMWRTTEAFKLREDMVSQFLRVTLDGIFTQSPSDYDITPIAHYLDPKLFDQLTGKAGETSALRLRTEQRRFFSILGFRRVVESKFPQFITVIVRADETIMNESKDQAGNVITSSSSNIVFVIVFLDQRVPTPANPWGLVIVGIDKGPSEKKQSTWEAALPLEGTRDKRNNIIRK